MPGVNVSERTTHHNAASAAADGAEAHLDGYYKSLTLQITDASAVGNSISFKGSVDGTNYTAIQGTKLSDGTTATSTTSVDEIWQFDVTGLESFLADLTALTSGTVTVKSIAVP